MTQIIKIFHLWIDSLDITLEMKVIFLLSAIILLLFAICRGRLICFIFQDWCEVIRKTCGDGMGMCRGIVIFLFFIIASVAMIYQRFAGPIPMVHVVFNHWGFGVTYGIALIFSLRIMFLGWRSS